MVIIPFSGIPKEDVDFNLNGLEVTLQARYSDVADCWGLTILDRTFDPPRPILEGVTLVTGVDVLHPFAIGLGGLACVSTDGSGVDPGQGELGQRVKVVYLTPDEVAAL